MTNLDYTATSSPFNYQIFLQGIDHRPGVYRMFDKSEKIIYVGKARDLKRRLASYFRSQVDSPKTRALVSQINHIEITLTRNEAEALTLENQLIKTHRPRYNVLLRDDKSYPYLYLSTDQLFPRLTIHRGNRQGKGCYFGPYPNGKAVRETLTTLQRLFPVRQCEDSVFNNRSRPCLQYQIGYCSGPCVGLVDEFHYSEDVNHTKLFLEGKNSQIIQELMLRMEEASKQLAFEKAAHYRDRIASLRAVQNQQRLAVTHDMDIVACVVDRDVACIVIFRLREGSNLGQQTLFPEIPKDSTIEEILVAFLSQYYLEKTDLPQEVLINHYHEDIPDLQVSLLELTGKAITFNQPTIESQINLLQMAINNAHQALVQRLGKRDQLEVRFQLLKKALNLTTVPQRIECFDVSHSHGEATVAACVVFNQAGPIKSDYRRFNINNITPGDDFAAMEVAITRHYQLLLQKGEKLPEVLLIDGGRGQLTMAQQVLTAFQITGITLIGVAKGTTRRPGQEVLFLSGTGGATILPDTSPALHLIQQVRDEAHRFAISGHRQRRAKVRPSSVLEMIPGLGPKRRRQVLGHFGGLQEVKGAGVAELAGVPGISRLLAERIYDVLHPH